MLGKFRNRSGSRPLARRSLGVGGWSRAIQHLDEALQQNAPTDYSEQIEILGRHIFGHLWTPRHLRENPSQTESD